MLSAMRTPVPETPADMSRPTSWRAPTAPFVIDVGANVGWFTINAAAAGGRVAAFEGKDSASCLPLECSWWMGCAQAFCVEPGWRQLRAVSKRNAIQLVT
jgi:purine-cytosine permease-like protein